MRKSLKVLVLSLMACLLNCVVVQVTAVSAADYRIAYVDSERIFVEFTGTKTVQSQFLTDLEGWVKQMEAKKADLDKLQREYDGQRLMLSDARRKEKEDELLAKQSEYNQLGVEIWGPTGKAATRNEALTRPLILKIKEVVQRIASQEGINLVFDASDGNLVYGDPTLDLTQRVLDELNKAAPGTGTSGQ